MPIPAEPDGNSPLPGIVAEVGITWLAEGSKSTNLVLSTYVLSNFCEKETVNVLLVVGHQRARDLKIVRNRETGDRLGHATFCQSRRYWDPGVSLSEVTTCNFASRPRTVSLFEVATLVTLYVELS